MPLTDQELSDLRNANARTQGDLPGAGGTVDWTKGFIQSGVENTLSLFGTPKSASTVAWERDNPLSGFASEFIGVGVPYVGWYKASKKIRRFDELLSSVSGAATAPVLGGAAREALRFTPLEAARLIGTGVQSPQDLPETITSSAFSLGIAGAAGALGGLGRAYGDTKAALKTLTPNVNQQDPTTLQLRQLREAVTGGKVDPSRMEEAQRHINILDRAVRNEELAVAEGSQINPRYVTNIYDATGTATDKTAKGAWLNSFFKPQESNNLSVKKLVAGVDDPKFGLGTAEAVQQRLDTLPQGSTSYMQYPRLVQVKADKPAFTTFLTNRFAQYMTPAGPGLWMTREADDGLFIMTKKIAGDLAGPIAKGDEFLTFKTDRPEMFGGQATGWMDKQVERGMWWAKQFPQNNPLPPNTAGGFVDNLMQQNTFRNWADDLGKPQDQKGFLDRVYSSLGVRAGDVLNAAQKQALAFAQENLSPTMFQWIGHGPGQDRARWLWGIIKPSFDRANTIAETMIYGKVKPGSSSNLLRSLYQSGAREGYIKGGPDVFSLLQKLDDVDRAKLAQVQAGSWDIATVNSRHTAGEISDSLHTLLSRLDDLDKAQLEELNQHLDSIGLPPLQAKPGHFMLSHMWDGDWRARIRNESGAAVYMVGGKDRGSVLRQAKEVIKRSGEEGKWTVDESADRTQDLFTRGREPRSDDVNSLLMMNTGGMDFRKASAAMESYVREAYSPGFFQQRKDIAGFNVDMTANAVAKRLFSHVSQMQGYIADTALRTRLFPQLLKLQDDNPVMLRQLQERWNNTLGIQGKFSQAINDFSDRVLSPYLGNNSANKIVGTANTITHNLQLGSLNLMYPTVNAFTFMSTVLPQVAFAASAPIEVLSQYYTSVLAHGTDGLAKRAVHMLDPMKMVYAGFRSMGKPTPEQKAFFERALEDGVFAPRLVEEHIGVDAQLKQRLSGLLQEKNGFVKFMQYVSEWLPNKSEQFSRLHAFTTGLATGKDLMGMEGERLYRFAKEFTHNTMFGYNLADRAKVITGPLGSFFGLYKNWQMHYLGWMLQYTGEAFRGNFAPLLWSQAGVGTLAGIGGTSAYGLANAFSQVATGKDAFNHIYNTFSADGKPDTFSDTMFYGLPALFGTSLQSSAAALGSNPARDAAGLFSFVQLERGKAIGKALGTSIDDWTATGKSPFSDPLARDQILKALAPRSLLRASQVIEGNYIKSLSTGHPVARNLSPGERFLYGLGFNSPRIDRLYHVSNQLFEDQEKRRNAVGYFARQLVGLQDEKDWKGVTRLAQDVAVSGVGMDSVLRSAEYIRQRSLRDIAQTRFGTGKNSDPNLRQFVEPQFVPSEPVPAPLEGQLQGQPTP